MNPADLPVRRARAGLVATFAILAAACATGDDPSGPTRAAPIKPDVADIVRSGKVLGFRLDELRAHRPELEQLARSGGIRWVQASNSGLLLSLQGYTIKTARAQSGEQRLLGGMVEVRTFEKDEDWRQHARRYGLKIGELVGTCRGAAEHSRCANGVLSVHATDRPNWFALMGHGGLGTSTLRPVLNAIVRVDDPEGWSHRTLTYEDYASWDETSRRVAADITAGRGRQAFAAISRFEHVEDARVQTLLERAAIARDQHEARLRIPTAPTFDAATTLTGARRALDEALAERRDVQAAAWARLGQRLEPRALLWWQIAEIRARLGARDPRSIVQLCNDALNSRPDDADRVELLRLRSAALAQVGRLDAAIGDTAVLLQLQPSDRDAQRMLHGLTAQQLERRIHERQRDLLRQRIADEPTDAGARIGLASALLQLGDVRGAIEAFAHVAGNAPATLSPALWIQYADLLGARGDYEGGLDAIALARTAHPDAATAFEPLTTVLLDQQRAANPTVADQGSEPEPAAEPGPSTALATWQARARTATTESKQLAAALDEQQAEQTRLVAPFDAADAAHDWQQWAVAWQAFAKAAEDLEAQRARVATRLSGQVDALQAEIDRATGDDEPRAQVLRQLEDALGELYQRADAARVAARARSAAAWADSQQALALIDDDAQLADRLPGWLAVEDVPPMALAAKGLLLYRQRQLAQAAVHLHGSLGVHPDHALASKVREALRGMDAIAVTMIEASGELRAAGAHEQAVAAATQAAWMAPHRADAFAARGRAHAAGSAWQEALDDFTRALALAPRDAAVRRARARMALHVRRFDLYLADAEALVAQEHGPEAYEMRSDAFELLLDIDRGWDDEMRAMRMRGKAVASTRTYRTTWESDLAQSTLYRLRDDKARAKANGYTVWQQLPWNPGPAYKALVGDRLLELLQNDAAASEWTTPLEGADEELARVWPSLARFVLADWCWIRGRRDEARPLFEQVREDGDAPARLAVLANHRLRSSFPHPNGTRDRDAILVPQDYADLDEAIRRAEIGQTILLAPGRHYSSLRFNKSLRIVGRGAAHTTIVHRGKNGEVGGRLQPQVGFEDLRLEGGPTRKPTADGEGGTTMATLAIRSGAAHFERVTFAPSARIWAIGNGAVGLSRCRTAGADSAPLAVLRGRALALIDRSQLGRRFVLADRASATTVGGSLQHEGSWLCRGEGTSLQLERVFVEQRSTPALIAQDGAPIEARGLVVQGQVRGAPATRLQDGPVAFSELVVLGRTEGLDAAAIAVDLDLHGDASLPDPTDVRTAKELVDAVAARTPHVRLAPGTYDLPSTLTVDYPLVLVAAAEGVVLRTRVDRGDAILATTDSAWLDVRDVGFAFQTSRPHRAIEKAFENLRAPHELYRCIGGAGRVVCSACTFEMPFSVTQRKPFAILDCAGGAALLARCQGKGRLIARERGQVWLSDGDAGDLEVHSGAHLTVSGPQALRRVEVSDAASALELLDAGSASIDVVATTSDGAAVRSARDRLRDGLDPRKLSKDLWDDAYRRFIQPMDAGDDTWRWVGAIDRYRDTLRDALRLVEPDEDVRIRRVAEALLPLFRGKPERLYRFSWTDYGNEDRRIRYRVQESVPQADRDWIKARATASLELGSGATEAEIDDYQPWTAARLKGEFTAQQVRDARANGYTIPQYRQHLARLEAERKRKLAAIRAAEQSGDRDRLRAALLAFGGDRYGRYLLNDPRATDHEIEQAIGLATDGSLARRLYQLQRSRQAAAAARAAQQRYQNQPTVRYRSRSRSSTSSYGNNGFQQWVQRSQRWNRSMDRWMSNFKSSQYNSYQNRY